MSVDRFDVSFLNTATDAELITFSKRFGESIKDHEAFQNQGKHVPGNERFMFHADTLFVVSTKAQDGGKLVKEEKERVRERIIKDFIYACQHMVMYADYHDNPKLLENPVFKLKQRAHGKTNQSLPEMPSKLTAKQEGPPGTVVITVSKCLGQGSIEIQITDNPNDEASWRSQERSYTCKTILNGLEEVKRYYVRARYHNSVGYGPWSQIISFVLT